MTAYGKPSQTVSVAKARRILGGLSKNLSDTQVIEIINMLHLLAKQQLQYNGSKDE
ncbi:MAG: hypothetical protein JWO54_298 [Candidatus Saccharibacteria bacterium]|nr:hypothetical protein [Candidatus Saccharibacteria bacterium]